MPARGARVAGVWWARTLWLLVVLLLSGCAARGLAPFPVERHADTPINQCANEFAEADGLVTRAGTRDGGEARIDTFPYLRIDRFLASLAPELAEQALPTWMERARLTDLRARGFELRNAEGTQDAARMTRIDECGARLMASDLSQPARLEVLRKSARVPDDYQTWKRIAGIYALARIPFASGVRGYQRETAQVFAAPLAQIKVEGRLVRYGIAQSTSTPDAPISMKADAAGIPEIDEDTLERLFMRHAPVFEVDDTGEWDRPGALAWNGTLLDVDSTRPTLYRRLAFTRYGARVLPQLVYGVWFSARPKRGAFDLLGGRLDGVMWRVTLDESGKALLFDSIHPCGCYHQFFPTARARLKPAPQSLDEYAFVPQPLDDYRDGQRVILRVATRTHYLQRVLLEDAMPAIEQTLRFAEEDELRSLPRGASAQPLEARGAVAPEPGFRSAFAPDGIVAGSERGERFLFWPMGVASPGAMRQYGRHATAFVGRRHFDDADLVARYFDLEGKR